MVCGSIDMIDAYGICTKLLHEIGIELTLSSVLEGIVLDQLIGST